MTDLPKVVLLLAVTCVNQVLGENQRHFPRPFLNISNATVARINCRPSGLPFVIDVVDTLEILDAKNISLAIVSSLGPELRSELRARHPEAKVEGRINATVWHMSFLTLVTPFSDGEYRCSVQFSTRVKSTSTEILPLKLDKNLIHQPLHIKGEQCGFSAQSVPVNHVVISWQPSNSTGSFHAILQRSAVVCDRVQASAVLDLYTINWKQDGTLKSDTSYPGLLLANLRSPSSTDTNFTLSLYIESDLQQSDHTRYDYCFHVYVYSTAAGDNPKYCSLDGHKAAVAEAERPTESTTRSDSGDHDAVSRSYKYATIGLRGDSGDHDAVSRGYKDATIGLGVVCSVLVVILLIIFICLYLRYRQKSIYKDTNLNEVNSESKRLLQDKETELTQVNKKLERLQHEKETELIKVNEEKERLLRERQAELTHVNEENERLLRGKEIEITDVKREEEEKNVLKVRIRRALHDLENTFNDRKRKIETLLEGGCKNIIQMKERTETMCKDHNFQSFENMVHKLSCKAAELDLPLDIRSQQRATSDIIRFNNLKGRIDAVALDLKDQVCKRSRDISDLLKNVTTMHERNYGKIREVRDCLQGINQGFQEHDELELTKLTDLFAKQAAVLHERPIELMEKVFELDKEINRFEQEISKQTEETKQLQKKMNELEKLLEDADEVLKTLTAKVNPTDGQQGEQIELKDVMQGNQETDKKWSERSDARNDVPPTAQHKKVMQLDELIGSTIRDYLIDLTDIANAEKNNLPRRWQNLDKSTSNTNAIPDNVQYLMSQFENVGKMAEELQEKVQSLMVLEFDKDVHTDSTGDGVVNAATGDNPPPDFKIKIQRLEKFASIAGEVMDLERKADQIKQGVDGMWPIP